MEQFSFTNLYKILNYQEWYNTAPEIEILKGQHFKPKTIKEGFYKFKRTLKINNSGVITDKQN